jgi:thiosulfate/3-mercaptopyruvate sulfurtransferase
VSLDWLDNQSATNLVILDTRPKTMYLYGHLENSQSLSIEQVIQTDQYGSNLVLDEKKITDLFSSLGIDDTKTVVIIGDYMDPSAARIAWTLLYFGHEKTFLLDSTISELQRNGFNFTKKLFIPKPKKFISKINPKIRIYAEFLRDNLDKFVILDARTPQEFIGGHLPTSKLIPFTEGIGYGDKLFQDSEFLKNLFSQNHLSKNDPIVCYCMHGHRASSLFFQLKIAGFENVQLYDGSFVEWHGRRFPLE